MNVTRTLRFKLVCVLLLLIKLSVSGQEIEWQKTIGGSWSDKLSYFELTADGGYILGGSSRSNISGDKTENNLGDYDYWIIKTDSSGNIQWQNTIGGGLNDIQSSIEQTVDGAIF
ncbi:MAG: hypothetical protein IPM91_20665 [Bacteroidetes bacterium]|nr:hypothetical protein [Bacteroidota bacterium]